MSVIALTNSQPFTLLATDHIRPARGQSVNVPTIRAGLALGALLVPICALSIAYVLGIRSKSPSVRDAARRFHRAVGNPLQMRSAGMPGRYASVLVHQGRTTGRTFETPVWAAPTEDGFVIRIVYGARTDWLKNVLANGGAALVFQGQTIPVDRPEIVAAASASRYFPALIRLIDRLIRVDQCLRVRRAEIDVEARTMELNKDQVIPYPKSRKFMEAAIRSTHNKPMMHGLVEVDVTRARTALRALEASTGKSFSFTAFVIGCLGRAVQDNKFVHVLRKGRKQLMLFDEIDVLTWIERDIAGQPTVMPCIVRAANRKTFDEISDEIRAAQIEDVAKIDVAGAKESQLLPASLYGVFFEVATRIGTWFPREWKRRWGTITLTAVGMVDPGVAFWGIPPSSPSACWITAGGIAEKEANVDGRVMRHEYLNLTVSFDHRMIDAAPAGRFVRRFKELLESAYGLPVVEKPVEPPIEQQRPPELVAPQQVAPEPVAAEPVAVA